MTSSVDETFARASFEATADELVDVSFRYQAASKTYRRSRRIAMLTAGLTVGLGILVVADPLWRAGQGFPVVIVAAVLGLAIGYVAGPVHEHSTKSLIRRYVAEHISRAQSVRCEVELRSSSISITQDNVEQLHRWEDVTAVNDTDAGVEIVTRHTILVVRNRAFVDRSEREAFITQARRLRSLAVPGGG